MGGGGVFLASLRSFGHYSCNSISIGSDTFAREKRSIVISVPSWTKQFFKERREIVGCFKDIPAIGRATTNERVYLYSCEKYLVWKRRRTGAGIISKYNGLEGGWELSA